MKKSTLICVIYSLLLVLFNSCISDEESQRQINSSFQGDWIGTFDGDYSGNINFTVSKEGSIDGSLSFSPGSYSEIFGGYINHDGKFDFNTKSNFKFSGILKNQKTATGIWNKANSGSSETGSFSIKRK